MRKILVTLTVIALMVSIIGTGVIVFIESNAIADVSTLSGE